MNLCGNCSARYDGSWFAHIRGVEHQVWFHASGRLMAIQLRQLDTAYAAAGRWQKDQASGQQRLFE